MKKPPVDRRRLPQEHRRFRGGYVRSLSRRSSPLPRATRRWVTRRPARRQPATQKPAPRIKFAVIGINHGHINSQVDAVMRGGGELVSVYAKEPDLPRRS